MSLVTPQLRAITTFDSTLGNDFIFDVNSGSQVVKNNLIIQKNSDNTEVYNGNVDSFQLKHHIGNILQNQTQYKCKIRTGDIDGNWSNFSQWAIFWCFQKGDVSIENITGGVVNNQNYNFIGNYIHHGDKINSYLFNLYSYDNVLIKSSPLTYIDLDIVPTPVIAYMFSGLQNNEFYKIELVTLSVHGVTTTTGLLVFCASYISPTLNSSLTLTNDKENGRIILDCQVIQIIGQGSNFTYENSDWVNITASNGIVSFTDGIELLSNDFTLKIWVKNIPTSKTFLKIFGTNGDIQLQYYSNRFHCFKTASGIVSHYVNIGIITLTEDDTICIMIRQINNAIDMVCENLTTLALSWSDIEELTISQISDRLVGEI